MGRISAHRCSPVWGTVAKGLRGRVREPHSRSSSSRRWATWCRRSPPWRASATAHPDGGDHASHHAPCSPTSPAPAPMWTSVETDGRPGSLIATVRNAEAASGARNTTGCTICRPPRARRPISTPFGQSRRSGRASRFGASHPHANPRPQRHAHPGAAGGPAEVRRHLARRAHRARNRARARSRLHAERRRAGSPAGAFRPDRPYALLIPGASAHRPGKRWPAESYGALAAESDCARARRRGDRRPLRGRVSRAPFSPPHRALLDLTGRTDFAQVAALGAKAALAVGNDTGPTHLVAAAGAPTLALFSGESDPALCGPRGARVQVLRSRSASPIFHWKPCGARPWSFLGAP